MGRRSGQVAHTGRSASEGYWSDGRCRFNARPFWFKKHKAWALTSSPASHTPPACSSASDWTRCPNSQWVLSPLAPCCPRKLHKSDNYSRLCSICYTLITESFLQVWHTPCSSNRAMCIRARFLACCRRISRRSWQAQRLVSLAGTALGSLSFSQYQAQPWRSQATAPRSARHRAIHSSALPWQLAERFVYKDSETIHNNTRNKRQFSILIH